MKYLYLDSDNKQVGPASLEEIRTLASEGKIPNDPQVCAEGTEAWKALSELGETTTPSPTEASATAEASAPKTEAEAEEPKKSKDFKLPISGTIVADFVGKLLGLLRKFLCPELLEKSLSFTRHFGQYAVLLGGALGLIAAIAAAIRASDFGLFVIGIAFVIALAVGQFTAIQFLNASDQIIESTPSRVSSMAFLDCIGLLSALGAVGLLIGGIVGAIQGGGFSLLILALLLATLALGFATVALHPQLAAIESGSGSAGEEAVALITFFLKGILKLVPFIFGLFAIVGSLVLLVSIFAPNSRFVFMLSIALPTVPVPGLSGGLSGLGIVFTATLLPIISYFMFMLASLPLELWRAILSLPAKLDALKK